MPRNYSAGFTPAQTATDKSRRRGVSLSRFCRGRGFTIIELLVVIAIIAVIAAILFPVFARSREKARATACLSNYHQIALATQMYASDFDGDTPPDGGSFAGLIVDCAPYTKSGAIFACPDDFDREKEARAGTYRMATLYQGKPISCGWLDPYTNAVTRSATTTLLYEAEKDINQQEIVPTFRHSGGAQILFFDGHAKWIKGNGKKDADD